MLSTNTELIRASPIELDQIQARIVITTNDQDRRRHGSFWYHVKKILLELCQNATCHGIPNIVRSSYWFVKIVWIISMLGCSAFCAFLIVSNIQEYLAYEVVTTTRIVLEIPTPFPTISFCNADPFTSNASIAFARHLFAEYNFNMSNLSGNDMNRFFTQRYLIGVNTLNPNLTDEYRQTLGMSLNDTMVNCLYDNNECNRSHFSWFMNTYYGSCFQFNSVNDSFNQPLSQYKATKSGIFNGLNMEIFLGEGPSTLMTSSLESGLRIFVENKTATRPFFGGVSIPAGFKSYIQISRTCVHQEPYPYSDCRLDIEKEFASSELVQAVLKKFPRYRQTDCFDACFQKFLIPECQCQDSTTPFVKSLDEYPLCLNVTQVACDYNFYSKFFQWDVKKICEPFCPLECEQYKYDIRVSVADYLTDVYYDYIIAKEPRFKNMTYSQLKQKLLLVYIYYEDLSYTLIVESPKTTIINLISNIGGNVGLFLGCSFLSVMEIVEALMRIFAVGFEIYIPKRRANRKA